MLILVRYGKIFLKSEPVLRLLEKKLIKNTKAIFKKNGTKCKIERKRGRIFVETTEKTWK